MQNLPRVPLTEKVTEQLQTMLQEEGFTEGDSIPSTGDLAKRFSVSRTVVREALAELTGRGLLNRQQGREGIVAVPDGGHLMQLFKSRIDLKAISFDQLQDFREVIEMGSARMAARHATRADVAQLSDSLHAMRSAKDDEEMLAADLDFHRDIAYIANPLFGLVLDGLNPILMESRRAVWAAYIETGGKMEVSLDMHAKLRDMIAESDEEGAERAMESDLADSRSGLIRMKP